MHGPHFGVGRRPPMTEHLRASSGVLMAHVCPPPFTQPLEQVFVSGGLTDHNPVRLYSVAQIVPAVPTGSFSFSSCVPLTHPVHASLCYKKLQAHLVCPCLSVISPRSPGYFLWRMELRSQDLGTECACFCQGVTASESSQLTGRGDKCM